MKRRLLQLAVLLAALGRVCAGDFEDRLNKGFWVRDYYNEVIQKKDRNVFLDYVPVFKEKPFDFYEHLGYELYWYEELNRLGDVCHDFYSEPNNEYCLFLLRRPFAVEEITKLKDCCYRIVTRDIKIDSAFIAEAMYEGCDWSLLKDKSEIQLYVEFDGDYLFIYTDEAKTLLATYCMYEKNEYNSFLEAVKTNDFDGMEFTFPRHADGTCNYEEANGNKEELTKRLIEATENNNAAEVRRLIAAGADVNAKNDDGLTALMVAAKKNSADVAKLLLAAGADMNAKDTSYGYRMTALMYAAVNNAADVAKLLIDAGADIEAKGRYSMTVLMWAAADNNLVDMAKLLLASGADMNAKDDGGMTALMHAAVYNAADMAKLLIDAGTDIEAKNNYGGTALMYAAEYDSADVAALLIESGADVNAKDDYGRTALMKADEAEERAVHVEKLLRAAGREPANAPDTERANPAPSVGKTAAVTENLRLRTDDRTTAEVVATLAAGTLVKILAVGREDAIDGILSNWVRVSVLGGATDRDGNAVAADTEGWLFGGYLSAAEDAESQSPNGEAAAAKAPVPTIALVAAGGAALAALLAAILLAVRKRKGGKEQM